MTIRLKNTATKEIEEFTPIHTGKVGLYACGPTVYSAPTIGNYRTFILSDLVRRVFELNGYEVRQVMNITDVGHLVGDGNDGIDKLEQAAEKEGKNAWEISEVYTDLFLKEIKLLNMKQPVALPKATEHIPEQIKMIQILEEKGFTYRISDGIYFDTSKLSDYGKLTGQKSEEKREGARVAVNPEKKHASDFALWKFSKEGEGRHMEWDSPWGIGFPGWHIECSAMSEKYLDTPFDIHIGGEDLAPVHHTNEIAQTEGAYGHEPANYWLHGGFVKIDGGKMSKSLGNAYIISDLVDRNITPLAYRYFTFQAHYRSPINFTWESIQAAQNALDNLREKVRGWDAPTEVSEKWIHAFLEAVNNDIDMPSALAVMHEMIQSDIPSSTKSATLLKMDEVLGLGLEACIAQPLEIPSEIQALIDERSKARNNKDWETADRLRDEIVAAGFKVQD